MSFLQVSEYYLTTQYTFVDHKHGSLVSQRQECFLAADISESNKNYVIILGEHVNIYSHNMHMCTPNK